MVEATQTEATAFRFDESGLERVIADTLRFKQRLRIGEEAYILLKAKNRLTGMGGTAGAAAAGAAVASSSAVATTFFAPTGLAAWLGLATAATPLGWVIAAAVVTGGGYYGVSRWFSGKGGEFVDTIPKYISAPIDVLGAALLDLLGSLALRVAAIDGRIDPRESDAIVDHFIHDWGFDATYVSRALSALAMRADQTRVKALAQELARFQAANPDCNAPAMQAELLAFLREVIAADGVLDEREELAIEAVERILQDEQRLTFAKAGESIADVSRMAGTVAGEAASVIGTTAKSLGSTLSRKIAEASASFGKDQKSESKWTNVDSIQDKKISGAEAAEFHGSNILDVGKIIAASADGASDDDASDDDGWDWG